MPCPELGGRVPGLLPSDEQGVGSAGTEGGQGGWLSPAGLGSSAPLWVLLGSLWISSLVSSP